MNSNARGISTAAIQWRWRKPLWIRGLPSLPHCLPHYLPSQPEMRPQPARLRRPLVPKIQQRRLLKIQRQILPQPVLTPLKAATWPTSWFVGCSDFSGFCRPKLDSHLLSNRCLQARAARWWATPVRSHLAREKGNYVLSSLVSSLLGST
jgi:hypothetical protein